LNFANVETQTESSFTLHFARNLSGDI